MKEYFIKLLNTKTGEVKTLRRMLSEKDAKFSQAHIDAIDKKGIKLVEFWEIK